MDRIMLGVVLWSNASDRKAVIWCEDQGDLAYMNASDSVLCAGDFFDAGDLVQFDMEIHQSTRMANNARLVIEKAGPELPKALLDGCKPSPQVDQGADVIQFSPTRHREALV